MHLTVKLSENVFSPYKTACKLKDMLKAVLGIIFVYLVF